MSSPIICWQHWITCVWGAGVLALGSCSREPTGAAMARDAGTGTGGHNAASGSGTLSGSSSQSSTGTALTPPFTGWSPVPGLPTYCDIHAADKPNDEPPLTWLACADNTPGCRELEISWAPPGTQYVFYPDFAGGVTSGGSVVVVRRKLTGDLMGWSDMLIGHVDGLPIAVLRARDPIDSQEPCAATLAAVGTDRIVAGVSDRTIDPPPAQYELQVLLAGGGPEIYSTLDAATLHGNIGNVRSPGSAFMALSFQPASILLTVPYDGSPPTVFAKFALDQPWQPAEPITVGFDVVFWAVHDDRAREHIYHSVTGVTETLLDIDGWDVLPARTDGKTLIWIQRSPPKSISQIPTKAELWSSPYAPSASGLVPQKVADLSIAIATTHTRLESDLVVIRGTLPYGETSWSRDIVVRLSDNVYWTVDAPAGMWWGETLYVTPDEIALPVQPPWKHPETFTIRRQKLADLGPPKPIAGLLGEP